MTLADIKASPEELRKWAEICTANADQAQRWIQAMPKHGSSEGWRKAVLRDTATAQALRLVAELKEGK